MLDLPGKLVTRYWLPVLAVWAALLAFMLVFAPRIQADSDDSTFLPDGVPSRVAVQQIEDSFDNPPALSVAAVLVERPGGLTGMPALAASTQPAEPTGDWAYLVRLSQRIQASAAGEGWGVLSPADPKRPFLRGSLVSPDSQAAVIRVDLPQGFVAQRSTEAVDRLLRYMKDAQPPPGLDVALSGSASYGRDYFLATQTSLGRTTVVSIIAVIVILLLTYRAVLAAAISLLTVTAAVIISVSILAIGSHHGWSVSLIVELFTIVIGYGAGVDFSLFFLSRYHEELGHCPPPVTRGHCRDAIIRALVGTTPAIIASAGTVAAGLALMYVATFKVFRTAGPAVAISVVISCLASLTLTPVLAYVMGPQTFWPRRMSRPGDAHVGFWDRLATFAVSRPRRLLIVGLAVLVPLAVFGLRQKVVYDTLADLPPAAQSVRGAAMFARHFPRGEMAPVKVLIRTERTISQADWLDIAAAVDAAVLKLDTVQRVRSAAHPLGESRDGAAAPEYSRDVLDPAKDTLLNGVLHRLLRERFPTEVAPRYLGREGRAAYCEIALTVPPYSIVALDSIRPLQDALDAAVRSAPAAARAQPRVYIAGDTAQMGDLRTVTDRDFWRVGLLVVVAIILIVTLLVRDLAVALFVMFATMLTYGAALAVTGGIFHVLFGTAGPDWKVEFFLFVILVAVGQDYNLFVLTRITEERHRLPQPDATRHAIARTGTIISCCGLIMAATLGSLASSPLRLLQELGVAFIVGLLLDTFLVRPLMVPAFVLWAKRLNGRKGLTDETPTA
ncbi:MAG: MMPL family transporter [Phycisphaerae bacterium]|nr:MMPL family transporter [Phycisphaerae bacterium]